MLPVDPTTGLEYVVIDGIARQLAKLPPSPERSQLKPFLKVKEVLPKSEWKGFGRRKVLGLEWLIDQKSRSSCTGFASAGALMKSRWLKGFKNLVKLSGAFIYAQRGTTADAGWMIYETLKVLQNIGTCTEQEVPWDRINKNQIPQSAYTTAARFKILEAYTADSFAEMASGIVMGFIPIFAVHVGGNFTRINSNGICGFDRGPGNHAVHADDIEIVNGVPCLDMPNSWGPTFGIDGRGYVTEQHTDSVQQDCYLIRAAADDPQDEGPPVTK